jgi:hypothetical protein
VICLSFPSLQTLLPVILGHVPAGASTKEMVHYGQEVESGMYMCVHGTYVLTVSVLRATHNLQLLPIRQNASVELQGT